MSLNVCNVHVFIGLVDFRLHVMLVLSIVMQSFSKKKYMCVYMYIFVLLSLHVV